MVNQIANIHLRLLQLFLPGNAVEIQKYRFVQKHLQVVIKLFVLIIQHYKPTSMLVVIWGHVAMHPVVAIWKNLKRLFNIQGVATLWNKEYDKAKSNLDLNEFVISPNPVKEGFILTFKDYVENAQIKIIDCRGFSVYSKQIQFPTIEIDILLSHFNQSVSPGLYFVVLESTKQRLIKKLTILE